MRLRRHTRRRFAGARFFRTPRGGGARALLGYGGRLRIGGRKQSRRLGRGYMSTAAGAPALLLERKSHLGTKLRITGKGRCNLTNTAELEAFLAHFAFPEQGDGSRYFLRNAFARFFVADLIAFFEDRGVPIVEERGGRVFPASNDAHQIAEALARFCREQGVQTRLDSRVSALRHAGGLAQPRADHGGLRARAGG